MKKSFLVILTSVLLALGGAAMVNAQEQPKPKKDTVNMDSNAKPEFYYPVEDEKETAKAGKGSATTITVIAGVVVVAGAALFILRRKKK